MLPYVRFYVVVKSSFKHTREECKSKGVYVSVISLYVLNLCCSVNGSVCFVCDSVREWFCETNYNMFRCGCYFAVECYVVL